MDDYKPPRGSIWAANAFAWLLNTVNSIWNKLTRR